MYSGRTTKRGGGGGGKGRTTEKKQNFLKLDKKDDHFRLPLINLKIGKNLTTINQQSYTHNPIQLFFRKKIHIIKFKKSKTM